MSGKSGDTQLHCRLEAGGEQAGESDHHYNQAIPLPSGASLLNVRKVGMHWVFGLPSGADYVVRNAVRDRPTLVVDDVLVPPEVIGILTR